jgi:hypothetical protein
MNMSYGLVKSFDIDHGELDGIERHECFVLGYELALIDESLKRPEPIEKPVHVYNRERIEKACHDAQREFTLNFMADDPSEGWLWLSVAPN